MTDLALLIFILKIKLDQIECYLNIILTPIFYNGTKNQPQISKLLLRRAGYKQRLATVYSLDLDSTESLLSINLHNKIHFEKLFHNNLRLGTSFFFC